MHEGADGTLFASYPSGTFRYDYGSNQWTELTSSQATALTASRDNTFFGSYGNGTFEYNGSWQQLASHVATNLAAVSNNDVYAVFSGDKTGTWHADNSGWHQITTAVPTAMAASNDGTLFASYTSGTWEYHPAYGWTDLYSVPAKDLVAVSYGDYIGTFSDGVWEQQNGGWTEFSPYEADNLGAAFDSSGVTLIGSFPSTGSYSGTLINQLGTLSDGTHYGAWQEITSAEASLVANS
jgi:hypothetical protein